MNRLLAWLPMVCVVVYMTAGHVIHFRADLMRLVTTVLTLIIVGTVFMLNRKGLASAIEKSFTIFICIASIVFWVAPASLGPVLAAYSAAILYGVLFLAAAVPPLVGGEPFTTHFARRKNPEAVWETDLFKQINLHLNWMWAGIFGVSATLAALPQLVPALHGLVPGILFQAVLPMGLIFGIGLPLSTYYPNRCKRKLGLSPEMMSVSMNNAAHERVSQPEHQPVEEESTMERPKVVAINGSPHVSFGNTGLMMEMLREPLDREGFDLEIVNLSELRIEYCIGCGQCLEKGACWIGDDYKALATKALKADAVVLGSPVYIRSVTAQMKTFLDRSVSTGHRPQLPWKPGLSVCVSCGFGETSVGEYLGNMLRLFGAFPVGGFTSIAVGPGQFLGKEAVEQRASDLARDLATAVKEKRRYPATDRDFEFWAFMGWLVRENRDFMQADHKHWENRGLYESFEGYVGQERVSGVRSPEMRKAWIKTHMEKQKKRRQELESPAEKPGPKTARTARELLQMMPMGLNTSEAEGLSAVYQFQISGDEEFTAHLTIADRKATYHEGPSENPNVTILTPADIWLKIARGELDGAQAFMSGKYKVQGDVTLLMKLNTLFSR